MENNTTVIFNDEDTLTKEEKEAEAHAKTEKQK